MPRDEEGSRVAKPEKRILPAYMVSFGDMVTNLLVFFILLCTMAEQRRCGLVASGAGSFVKALNAFGLPGIAYSGSKAANFSEQLPRYAGQKDLANRADVVIRQFLDKIRRISPIEYRLERRLVSILEAGENVVMPIDIEFVGNSTRLAPDSREVLDNAAPVLDRARCTISIEAYVDERFPMPPGYKSTWELTAARAASVAKYLHESGGISYRRLVPTGRGSFHPLVKNGAQEHRVANTRVVIIMRKEPHNA